MSSLKTVNSNQLIKYFFPIVPFKPSLHLCEHFQGPLFYPSKYNQYTVGLD